MGMKIGQVSGQRRTEAGGLLEEWHEEGSGTGGYDYCLGDSPWRRRKPLARTASSSPTQAAVGELTSAPLNLLSDLLHLRSLPAGVPLLRPAGSLHRWNLLFLLIQSSCSQTCPVLPSHHPPLEAIACRSSHLERDTVVKDTMSSSSLGTVLNYNTNSKSDFGIEVALFLLFRSLTILCCTMNTISK